MDNKDSLKELLNNTNFTKKTKKALLALYGIAVSICAILMIAGAFLVSYDHLIAFICCWSVAIAIFVVLCIGINLIKKTKMKMACDSICAYIDTYSKNEVLCTIIKNYVASNTIPIFVLEYTFLPLELKKSLIDGSSKIVVLPNTTYKEKTTNVDSVYSKMICRYNASLLNQKETHARIAYYIRDNIFFDESKKMTACPKDAVFFANTYYELYMPLRHQNIIPQTDDKLSYYAFLFLVYMAQKYLTGKKTIEQLDNYCLSIDDDNL